MIIKKINVIDKTVPVSITGSEIKLCQLLKLVDAADSGGEAKMLITEGEVRVNNALCFVAGKKLHDGDKVAIYDMCYKVVAQG